MKPADRIWQAGERCRLTFMGRSVEGRVELVANSRPAAVAFDGILAGIAGAMLLVWDGDGCTETFSGIPVELVPLELELEDDD